MGWGLLFSSYKLRYQLPLKIYIDK